jgi:selenocysteine lyase/cysteine desulfurase
MKLLGMLQDGFAEIPGVTLHGTRNLVDRVPTMSVSLENYDAADVGAFLDVDHDILTRTGLHCAPLMHEHYGTAPRGTVRFSIGPFNTEDHILSAIKAVETIQAQRPPEVSVASGAAGRA